MRERLQGFIEILFYHRNFVLILSLWFVRIGGFLKEKVINNIILIKGRLEGGDVKQRFGNEKNEFFNGAEDGKKCKNGTPGSSQ